jgi:hypothetical protein
MGLPTVEHVIFIPVVLMLGGVIGFIFGSRAARTAIDKKRKRNRE